MRRLTRGARTHNEGSLGLHHGDGHLHAGLGIEGKEILARLEVLPLGADGFGVVDIQAHEVLEEVVAVEAAAVLAELHQPRPDGEQQARAP